MRGKVMRMSEDEREWVAVQLAGLMLVCACVCIRGRGALQSE